MRTTVILVLLLGACDVVRLQTWPEPPDVVPPDFVATEADLQRWARTGDNCDNGGDLARLTRINIDSDFEWVVVANDVARRRVIENRTTDGRSNAVVDPSAFERNLTGGDASVGAAIRVEVLAAVAEGLAAGGDLILGSNPDRPNRPAEPEPLWSIGILLPDGRFAMTGCGFWVTDEVNAYMRETGVDDPRAELFAILGNDSDAVGRHREWRRTWLGPDRG